MDGCNTIDSVVPYHTESRRGDNGKGKEREEKSNRQFCLSVQYVYVYACIVRERVPTEVLSGNIRSMVWQGGRA